MNKKETKQILDDMLNIIESLKKDQQILVDYSKEIERIQQDVQEEINARKTTKIEHE